MEKRKVDILNRLEQVYQGTTTALNYSNPFEILIATMLSAQTTDQQVNKITAKLFRKYPTPESIANLSEEELAQEIKGCGLYRTKARNILSAVRILLQDYGGSVPQDRESLMSFPGVGRKTANVVLANAFNIPALGVDTHIFRVSNRLELGTGRNPQEVEEALMKLIPRDKWAEAHHWLIWHGRLVCRARKPLCPDCPVRELCPVGRGED